MVKEIYLEKANSKKTGKYYLSVVFDCQWTKVRLFADRVAICSIFDLKVEDLANLSIGQKLPLVIGK